MKILVNKQKCPQNHVCPSIKVCPKGAISQETPFSLPVVDAEKCIVCGKCMQFCPMGHNVLSAMIYPPVERCFKTIS